MDDKLAFGIPWYTPENYLACLAIFDDAAELHETYDNWHLAAVAISREMRDRGYHIVEAIIEPVEFLRWCAAHGHRPDKHGRIAFANVKARDAMTGR